MSWQHLGVYVQHCPSILPSWEPLVELLKYEVAFHSIKRYTTDGSYNTRTNFVVVLHKVCKEWTYPSSRQAASPCFC